MLWVWLDTRLSEQLLTHATLLSYLVPLNLNLLLRKSKDKYVLHKITVRSRAIITKGLEKHSLEACGTLANVKMWGVYLSLCATYFLLWPPGSPSSPVYCPHPFAFKVHFHLFLHLSSLLVSHCTSLAYSLAWCLWMWGEIFLWHFLRIVITCRRILNW